MTSPFSWNIKSETGNDKLQDQKGVRGVVATQMRILSAKVKNEYISLRRVWDLSKVYEKI